MAQENTIVTSQGKRPPLGDLANFFEPAFCAMDSHVVVPTLPDRDAGRRYLAHLGRHVALNPGDLLAHTRRVLISVGLRDRDACRAAWNTLLDVLGDKGATLRTMLSSRVEKTFSPEDAAFVATRTPGSSKKILSSRTLHGRYPSDITIVTRKQRTPEIVAGTDTNDTVSEAQRLLGDGQIEAACELLKAVLLADPEDAAVSRELLGIYTRVQDMGAISALLEHFGDRPFALSDRWLQAEVGMLISE